MNLSEYTQDNICRAMGLSGFVESSWQAPSLRLLLKPSFNPEVCITAEDDSLRVVACREMLWHRQSTFNCHTFRDQAAVKPESISELLEAMKQAALARAATDTVVVLDGMPVAAYAVTKEGDIRFEGNPCSDESLDFVSSAIKLAWHSCSDPAVKNALSDCGRYVSLELSKSKVPDRLPEFNIAVIGDEEKRSSLLDGIDQQSDKK